MNKSRSLILSLLILLVLVIVFSLNSQKSEKETVFIGRVVDGDTLSTVDGRTIRLLNINTPEKGAPGFQEATDFLKSLENSQVDVEIEGSDRYNRHLARIYAPEYINLYMVREGLASKFLVVDRETKSFAQAEELAIKEGKGMWKPSVYSGCFNTEIFPEEEKVIFYNECPEVSLQGWYLKDESRKTYYFKNVSFSKITFLLGDSLDNGLYIFWRSDNVWNDDRDTLYLFDNSSSLVHYNSYGY